MTPYVLVCAAVLLCILVLLTLCAVTRRKRVVNGEATHEPCEEHGPDENTPPWMRRLP